MSPIEVLIRICGPTMGGLEGAGGGAWSAAGGAASWASAAAAPSSKAAKLVTIRRMSLIPFNAKGRKRCFRPFGLFASCSWKASVHAHRRQFVLDRRAIGAGPGIGVSQDAAVLGMQDIQL